MRNFKKFIAVMISALILASCLSVAAFAEEGVEQSEKATIVAFSYDNTDKVAKADAVEYASEDNDYFYKATTGDGLMCASVTGEENVYKHLEWSGDIYSDADGKEIGLVPAFTASTKNNWTDKANVSATVSGTKDYKDYTVSVEIGGTKKSPANYTVYLSDNADRVELGKISLSNNKTMQPASFEVPEKYNNSESLTVVIALTNTTSIEGVDLSENPSSGEIAINNLTVKGNEAKAEDNTSETTVGSDTEVVTTESKETTKETTTESGETTTTSQQTATSSEQQTTATQETTVEVTATESQETTAPAITEGYYITGSSGLCGTEWKNSADPNTLMKTDNGKLYYHIFENISAGTYNFKAIYVNAKGDVEWHPDGMGNDSSVEVKNDGSTVRVILVLTGVASNDCAIAEVFAPGEEIPEPTAPTTVAPTTAEPTTESTTVAPTAADGKLTVNLTSNISTASKVTYDTTLDKTFTVAFNLKSALKIINTQGCMTYDNKVLKLESFELLNVQNTIVNPEVVNEVNFDSTEVQTPADFSTGKEFIKATFTIISTGVTSINLRLDELNATSGDKDVALVSDGVVVSKDFTSSSSLSAATTKPTQAPVSKKIKLSATKKSLKAGKTYKLTVQNTKAKPKYSSSKKSVATVSSNGKITALKKGNATITVTVSGKKLKCKVTVTSSPKAKIGKKAFKKSKTYTIKKGRKLTVSITGKASSIKNSYKTSSKKVAKVTSKKNAKTIKIKGLKKGKATIKVTVNKSTTFKIKVKVK